MTLLISVSHSTSTSRTHETSLSEPFWYYISTKTFLSLTQPPFSQQGVQTSGKLLLAKPGEAPSPPAPLHVFGKLFSGVAAEWIPHFPIFQRCTCWNEQLL